MRIISFIDQPDVIKKIFQLEVSLKVKPSILPTAYHLEVDLSPLYRAVNLIKRLSAPKTFDLLDRVSFTTLKCHQPIFLTKSCGFITQGFLLHAHQCE